MKQNTDYSQNPWAGLSSYEDPEYAERKLKFCGRDDDSYDVAKLIMGNIFVTLYGKSGIGKTSLLNAGVFPELREDQYTPISFRLGIRDEKNPKSYQSIIVEAIERTLIHIETINVIDEQTDSQAIDYLWNYFARHRFYDKNNEPTTPVVVFDQFEEVFRYNLKEVETLLRQLDYINDKDHTLDACIVDNKPYRYEQNFRFVVSIREDDLYRLEDSLDNCFLPALKRCRYRLHSLSEQGARDAILIPGEGLFKTEEQDAIVKSIIDKSRNENGSISTNIVSLLCNRIYEDFQRSDDSYITPSHVNSFLKGNPFERFYNEATRGFSNREKNYIEDHLVDSTGRRNSIPESDFLLHVKKGATLLEGKCKILQRTSTSSDDNNHRVELIHDSFCEPLSVQKEKREKRKRLRQMAFIAGITLLSICIIASMCYQYWNIKKNQARFVTEKALRLIDEGDSYLAQRLLIEVMPKKLNLPNKPYIVEAEEALRKANINKNNAILSGHTGNVNSAVFSPNGKRIVSSSNDKTIRIWDVETCKCINTLKGHTGEVCFATFSPNGKNIVSASADSTIRIWDTDSGKQIGKPLKGHRGVVNSAVFSPDGKRIISASSDSTIHIWNVDSGKCIRVLKGHLGNVFSATISPNGKYIASISADSTIRIWDAYTFKPKGQPMVGHKDFVNHDPLGTHDKGLARRVSFSPDSKHIVTASYYYIRIWDIESGQHVYTQECIAHDAAYSPNGKHIVFAWGKGVEILDIEEDDYYGNLHFIEPYNRGENGYGYSQSVAVSPDGKCVVAAADDMTIRIWDVETSIFIPTRLFNYFSNITYSPDGKHILSVSGYYKKIIKIWDLGTKKLIHTLDEHTDKIMSAVYSPHGKHIVSASDDNTIKIWDTKTGKCIHTLREHTEDVNYAEYSHDAKHIVSASNDKTIKIWNAKTGKCEQTLKGHTNKLCSAVFSFDDKLIVSASVDSTIRIWDAISGRQIGNPLKGHRGMVLSAVFSLNAKHIVSVSTDNTIRIWNVTTGEQIGVMKHDNKVISQILSPDGKKIVSASEGILKIWDTETGQCIHTLDGHQESVKSVAYSQDSKHIISTSFNNNIKIWDTKKGKCISNLSYSKDVNSAVFSPNGRSVLCSADDGFLIWDFPPLQQLIDETRERFKNRKLTPEERRKYYLE